jgi:DNA mismatch repair protein MutS2
LRFFISQQKQEIAAGIITFAKNIGLIYPADLETKIGFDRIRAMLIDRCMSSLGRRHVERIGMLTQKDRIELLLNQTEEFRQILLQSLPFPQSNYFDPTEAFRRIKPFETFLEPEDLLDLKLSYETILRIIAFLSQRSGEENLKFPWLATLTADLKTDPQLPKDIDRIIDERAEVRSSASPVLAELRRRRQRLEVEANRKIAHLLQQAKSQGLVSSDVELALRNGRQVIPIAAGHKRKIRGIIHDQSATGQTVFLEPEEVFEINNEIRELDLEERQEIIRILKTFTDRLRPLLPDLNACYHMLGIMDAIRAKALIALDMLAQKPRIKEKPGIQWIKAMHPLLYLSHKAQKKHVEPLDITLENESRILVISGPNAGGKSVCLKTCGLLQYMIQCGLLVPMADYSEAGIFDQLFIDIGDQQSLENDLSTYSSHLLSMKHFMKHCNSKTLFLIDEFGAGTEPRIGGAIAEAILANLNKKGAFGVVTTHYANLKLMAGKHQGIANGSMLFDTRNMRPLFRLKSGNPGSSFAFEIARNIGLPEDILAQAGDLAGVQELDFDRQLQDLDLKKAELEDKGKELRSADQFLSEMIDKYERLSSELESRKADIMAQARVEAKKVLADTNRMIENTIRKIKEAQASKEETRQARQEMDQFIKDQEEKLGDTKPKPKKEKKTIPVPERENTPIILGDAVRVEGQQSIGEVVEISGSKAVVSFGSIKFRTKLSSLEKIKKSSLAPAGERKVRVKMAFDINEKAAAFNPQIDIKGLRVEEALIKLRRYIDDAILLGVKQVKILHGKGDGILREAVRDLLQGIPEVSRCRDEHPDRGGAGATIADFR